MTKNNSCKHIAIIMDGNGRWAKKRAMPRTFGHKKGAENVVNITRAMKESGIKFLTLYAFSTENWQRSEDEVKALMDLLREYLDKEFKEIMENYLKPISNGRRIVFPKDFLEISTFTTTCDWCVYNRLFVSRTAEWEEMGGGTLDISTYYYEANPASVLLSYINDANQIWNYG